MSVLVCTRCDTRGVVHPAEALFCMRCRAPFPDLANGVPEEPGVLRSDSLRARIEIHPVPDPHPTAGTPFRAPFPHDQTGSYRVLAMDAGGVHGLFSALILRRLEDARPGFLSHTTIFTGTSAGGIMSLLLSSHPDPAAGLDDCIELWQTPDLFSNTPLGTLLGAVGLAPLYSSRPLRQALGELIDPALRLSDLPYCVVVPTIQLDNALTPALRRAAAGAAAHGHGLAIPDSSPRGWRCHEFRNFPVASIFSETLPKWAEDANVPLDPRVIARRIDGETVVDPVLDAAESVLDVALRTSAGPVGMPAHQGYIDGALYAPNAALAGLASAVGNAQMRALSSYFELTFSGLGGALDSAIWWAPDRFKVLSIGTGRTEDYAAGQNVPWGYGQWMASPTMPFAVMRVTVDTGEEFASHVVYNLIGRENYRRLNARVPESAGVTSITGDGSIPALVEAAMAFDLGHTIEWLDDAGWTASRPAPGPGAPQEAGVS